jgi:hypothetical protein
MVNKNSTEIKEGKSRTTKIVIALCALIIVGALLIGAISLYNNNYFASTDKIVKIENVFVDVNGDGLQDYVRYAEVVINTGNLTPSP